MDTDPSANERLTAEEFLRRRDDEPDTGRWSELVAGRVVLFEPPDPVHGNVVLHVSKLVADVVQRNPAAGCPAFHLGLVVAREPDTVRFPLVAWFPEARTFDHADESLCEVPPPFVIDVVSTPVRRRGAAERVCDYLEWGVETVWLFDTVERTIRTHSRGAAPTTFGSRPAPTRCR